MSEQIIEIDCNNLSEKYSFNKVAKQASGAVLYQCGDAVLLATVAIDLNPVTEDFLPLTVQYIEKSYAAAKIPGGFIKRETKPGDFETLTSRIIDRSLRPLFPKGFHYPVVITVMVLSSDENVDMQVVGMNAASSALYTSDIPIRKLVSAVRIGKIDNKIVINPTFIEQDKSTLDLLVVGSGLDILMIEMCVNASKKDNKQLVNELDEDELLEILEISKDAINRATKEYEDGFRDVIKDKIDLVMSEELSDVDLYNYIESNYEDEVSSAIQSMAKSERNSELEAIEDKIYLDFEGRGEIKERELISEMLSAYKKSVVRSLILDKNISCLLYTSPSPRD